MISWLSHDRSAVNSHAAVSGSHMNFRDLSWWPPLFSPQIAKLKENLLDTVILPL